MYTVITANKDEKAKFYRNKFFIRDASGCVYFHVASAHYWACANRDPKRVALFWASPAPCCVLLWGITSADHYLHDFRFSEFAYHSFSYCQLIFSSDVTQLQRQTMPTGSLYRLLMQLPLEWHWYKTTAGNFSKAEL